MNEGASTPAPLVLVIEDDAPIRRFLRAALEANGYRFREAVNGKEGVALAATDVPDLVLLDLGLPDLNGFEVVKRLREWSQVPVVVVSARGQEQDKILALDAGADDYVTKPFGPDELIARLEAVLRRTEPQAEEAVLGADGLELAIASHSVCRDGAEVHLTPTEFELLQALMFNRGRLMTHGALLTQVWGPAYADDVPILRSHIANLRRKIEPEGSRSHIRTEAGIGYRFLD